METLKKPVKLTTKPKETIKDKTCPIHGTDMIVTATGLYCPHCKLPGWGD